MSSTEANAKSIGALLGHAVGNVMGLQWEGMTRHYVASRTLRVPTGESQRAPDDDVAMALVLARHLLDHPEGIEPKALLGGYVDWMKTNGRGIGGLTLEVLQYAAARVAESARHVWEQRGGSKGMVLGNGSVMRCAPLAICRRRALEQATREACLDSSLTHWDERCRWAEAAVVLIVAGHLNGSEDPTEEAVRLLEKNGASVEVVRLLVDDEFGSDFPDKGRLDGFDSGSCLVALCVARWASQWATDYEQSLTRVLRAGGDTDTNGAIAGAILGARFPDGIPESWLACVPDRQEIAELAAKLFALSGG